MDDDTLIPPTRWQRWWAVFPCLFFRLAMWVFPLRAYEENGKAAWWAASGAWFWEERREGRI